MVAIKGLSLLKGFRLENIKPLSKGYLAFYEANEKKMKRLTWTEPVNINEGKTVYLLLIRWLRIRDISIVTTVKTIALYLSLDLHM